MLNKFSTPLSKSDYVLPRLYFNSCFKVRIRSRQEWRRGFVVEDTISFYSDVWKMNCETETLVFTEGLIISFTFRLLNSPGIYQRGDSQTALKVGA